MDFKVNGAVSGLQNMYDLINSVSPGKKFSPSNLTFGPPSRWVFGQLLGGVAPGDPLYNTLENANTKISITALQRTAFIGTVERAYIRRNPGASHDKNSSLRVLIAKTDSQQRIKEKILAAVGCIAADVTSAGNGINGAFRIPTSSNDLSCAFTLTAKDSSYVYLGSFTALLTVL